MKIIAAAFYLFLCSGGSMMAQKENDVIEWSVQKLSWNDFKGTPKAMRAVAMTNSGIYFKYGQQSEGILNFTIVGTFDKKHSWVQIKGRTDEVLRHEQLHFDITELHARMLRRYFSEQPFAAKKNLSGIINRHYKEQMQALNRMQNKYDSETKHGTRSDAQRKWEERIHRDLEKLASFTHHELSWRLTE